LETTHDDDGPHQDGTEMAKAASSRPRRRRKTAKKATGGRLWFWLLALVVVLGSIVAYDNSKELRRFVASNFPSLSTPSPASRQVSVARQGTASSPARPQGATPVPPLPVGRGREAATVEDVLARQPALPLAGAGADIQMGGTLVGRGYRNTFYFCGTSGLDNCVADGGVFWFQKQQIRLADVVAPKTENARCDSERQKGFAAKVRLRDLLNQGGFDLVDWPNADGDGRGRKLRVVMRNGQSIGQQLVREGLVHGVSDAAKPWCG
jgi:endonuclease YncB( thermonuclease family)